MSDKFTGLIALFERIALELGGSFQILIPQAIWPTDAATNPKLLGEVLAAIQDLKTAAEHYAQVDRKIKEIENGVKNTEQMSTNLRWLLNHVDVIHTLVSGRNGRAGTWQERTTMSVDGVRRLVRERDGYRRALDKIQTAQDLTEAGITAKVALAAANEERRQNLK